MKGKLVSLLIRFGCTATIAGVTLVGAQAQDVVINELNLITGPDVGQFVELHGDPGTSLDGHSLVLVKSTFESANNFVPETQAVVDLGGVSLNDEGFFLIEGAGWQSNVVAVVLAASPGTTFELGTSPTFGGVLDAVLYGSVGVTHPQMSPLVGLVSPDATETVNEASAGESAGPDGLSRLPDGGEAFDQAFVMQALSPGTTNVLPCEGGHLSLNNPEITTFCTDLGPEIVGFSHLSDSPTAITSLAVLDEATWEVLEVFLGTAINMEGFGDDTLLVHAISHDVVLADDWTTLDSITSVSGGGCISVAEVPVLLIGETCEIPSCDGGTMLSAGGDPDTEACLTEDGPWFLLGITAMPWKANTCFWCATTTTTFWRRRTNLFRLCQFESAGSYHVWGLSYQDGLDASTVSPGMPVSGASALGCDSLSSNALEVLILECGSAGLVTI